ncbi:ferritin-like domain-containing protein [soil metagenome]
MSSEGFHEPRELLRPETLDHHRAITSIMEELEAVDWYDQRVDATSDPELAEILGHNRDEEKEHMAMTLEWLRRRDAKIDEHLRTYLFTEGSVLAIESAAEHGGADPAAGAAADAAERAETPPSGAAGLGIGSLRASNLTL